jgi:hypothetical protein
VAVALDGLAAELGPDVEAVRAAESVGLRPSGMVKA